MKHRIWEEFKLDLWKMINMYFPEPPHTHFFIEEFAGLLLDGVDELPPVRRRSPPAETRSPAVAVR